MAPWRKSSRSSGSEGQCVETRNHAGHFQIRDSKLGDTSPILDMSSTDWHGFLNLVRR